MNTNDLTLMGRCKRIDGRYTISKAGKPMMFLSVTIFDGVNENKVEFMSMQFNKDGSKELATFTAQETILKEYKALYKTVKNGDKDAEVIKDETIVEKIEDCDVVSVGNYKSKRCNIEINRYMSNGELVERPRISANFMNRIDEDKVDEEKFKSEFVVFGRLSMQAVEMEINEKPIVKLKVIVPTYDEGYGDRKESVKLNELEIITTNEDYFDTVLDMFDEVGKVVCINGDLVRTVERIEKETPIETEGRGFGRQVKQKPEYQTNITEFLRLEGGYDMEEDEVEAVRAFNGELWKEAKVALDEEIEKIKNSKKDEKKGNGRGVFGRQGADANKDSSKKPSLPF